MASPRCPRSATRRSESITRRFSGSSDSARPKSMVCVRAVPFRRQRNMRFSVTTLSGRRSRPKPRFAVKFTKRTGNSTMDDIVTEHAGSILRVQFNRPTKRNAMTSAMYVALAGIFNKTANDENTRVVLWHGAGDSFCAGNDIEDFLKNPPGPGESPQAGLMNALVNFDKPLVAAVHCPAIGGCTTMLPHCDFIYPAQSTKLQMPFIHPAVRPGIGMDGPGPAAGGAPRRP